MSDRPILSGRESLRRAEEHSERLKDQMSDANDIYKDARDLQDAVDPSIEDFQLPDAIDRMATETIELREQRKAFKADLEVLTEEAKELEEETLLLEMELQSTQITNEVPEEFTKERLAVIKRLFEADSRLTALVFQDQSLFEHAIRDIRAQGNQYLTKLKSLMEEVQSLKGDIQSAREDYDGRLSNHVQPLLQELGDVKQQLEASKALQSSTDEELTNVKEELSTVTQAHQTSEIALQKEIETHKTEIARLQGESTTMRYLSTEIQSLNSENARAKAQITQLEGRLSQSQVTDLEGRVQRLEERCGEQMEQKHQQSEEIRELKSDLAGRDNTLQETIKRSDTERTSSLQQIQQLQHFLFSKMLLIQHDRTVSLSTSGTRLLLKRQQLSHDTPAQWIQGPLKETMDMMTNSTETSTLAETYQLVLGSLTYLQSSTHFQEKESLLECMETFQTWLIKACKGRTSILGLALARVVKTIQEGPQFDPWFSIDNFDSARMIDARNSELPETTTIIGDGFTHIVLLVEGADIQVCQATDMFMRQQMDYGMQLVFDEALGLPALQLLADSFPHKDRWQPLGVWAVKVGRFNLVKRSGRVHKPEEFEEL